jgi:hypothetical protein
MLWGRATPRCHQVIVLAGIAISLATGPRIVLILQRTTTKAMHARGMFTIPLLRKFLLEVVTAGKFLVN